jgi:hypothetical protein
MSYLLKSLAVICAGSLFNTNLFCQQKWKVAEASLSVLTQSNGKPSITHQDLQKLAPSNSLLQSVNTGSYNTQYNFSQVNPSTGTGFRMLLGLEMPKSNNAKYTKLFRVGFAYLSNSDYSKYYYKTDKVIIDSFVSLSNGQKFFADSVNNDYFSTNLISDEIRLDANLIFRTNPKAIFSLYGGVGLSLGTIFNASVEARKTNNAYRTFPLTNSTNSNYYSTKTESNAVSGGFSAMVYIPMGFDVRFSKKPNLWQNVHFFTEVSPSFGTRNVGGLASASNVGVQGNFGLKLSW